MTRESASNDKKNIVGINSNKEASKIRALTTALFSRMQLGLRHGLQFDGVRDLYTVFGYKKTLTYADYLGKYIRGDIARRIIDAYPQATWARGVEVDGGDAFNTAWEELAKDHKLWTYFERLDKLCGLGHYSIMVMGYGDKDMTKPAPKGANLLFVTVHSEATAVIHSLVTDPTNERFGLPELYEIDLVDPTQVQLGIQTPAKSEVNTKLKVHYSRVLHVVEGNLEDDVFGVPRMSPIYNKLDDLDKVVGGSAETYWLVANRGMHVDVDKDMEMDADDEDNLSDELLEYQHELRRFIRTRGVKVKSLGSETPSPKASFETIISVISGATGIPQRILLGSEAGHLASEQDRANWADRIEERRSDFAEPIVLRPFITMMVATGVLPEPSNLEIKWAPAFTMSPLESAMVMAQKGRALANMTKQYEQSQALITPVEARGLLGFEGEAPARIVIEAVEDEEDDIVQTDEEKDEDENGRPTTDNDTAAK